MILGTKTNPDASTKPSPPGPTPSEPSPVDEIIAALAAVRQSFVAYIEARRDALGTRVRRLAVWVLLALLGAVVVATALVTGVVLVVLGAADGIGVALGQHFWAGKLVVGMMLIAGAGIGAWSLAKRRSRASFRKTVKKYESQRTHR